MEIVLKFSLIFLSVTALLCITRALKGPTSSDRIIAINVVSTKTIVVLVIVSYLFKETYFVDVALVYALISFISSIAISNTIGAGGDNW